MPRRQRAASGRVVTRRTDSSVIEKVIALIRDAIVRGIYHSGERLNQSRLAAQFGVSRIPVREALRQLDAEGLVSFDHNRGAHVARLGPNDVRDIFEMRVELESMALCAAVPNASARELETARALLQQMGQLEGEPERWLRLNNRFHATLYRPSGRRHLLRVIQSLRHAVEPYLRLYLLALHRFDTAQAQHQGILDAYAQRDVTRARMELRRHLLDTMHELLGALGGTRRVPVGPPGQPPSHVAGGREAR